MNSITTTKTTYNIGDFIIKKTYDLFGTSVNKTPVLEIKKIGKTKSGQPIFNNAFIIFDENNIEKVTPELATLLFNIFEKCIPTETENAGNINTCIREDNGQPKQKIKLAAINRVLFRFRMTNPSGNYEAYKCSICDHYHLGKRKISRSSELVYTPQLQIY